MDFKQPRVPYSGGPEDLYRDELLTDFRSVDQSMERQRSYIERPIIKKEIIQKQRIVHKLDQKKLESLRLLASELVGNILERANFLNIRISEIDDGLNKREKIHTDSIREIESDIDEKIKILASASNKEDVRELQMDITTLKMEKRRENLGFWRDVLQLKRDLRELVEQYEIEMKIANLFKDLK